MIDWFVLKLWLRGGLWGLAQINRLAGCTGLSCLQELSCPGQPLQKSLNQKEALRTFRNYGI